MRYAYDYARLIGRLDAKELLHDFFSAPHFYAPLVHLVTAVLMLAFGASRLSGTAVNLISLAVLLLSVSWISGKVSAAPEPAEAPEEAAPEVGAMTGGTAGLLGLLAAMIAACSHFSAWLVHDAFLDFPLTAAVAASFAFLLRAGDFRSTRRAIQFGLAAGLGMLIKQTYAFFFVLPGIYIALRTLYSRDRRAIFNLILACAVLVAVAAVWYWPHFHDVIAIYRENQRAAIDENEAPLFSYDSNFFCVHALLSFQLQLPFAILMVIGLVYSGLKNRHKSLMLCLWLLSGLVMFALVANKDVRYTVPIVPAAAIIGVQWLKPLLIHRRKQFRAAGVISAIGIAFWSLISFVNAQWPAEGMGTYINTPRYQWMVLARNYYGFDHRPLPNDWHVPDIVRTVIRLGSEKELGQATPSDKGRATSPRDGASPANLSADGSSQDQTPTLGVVVNLPYLNPSNVALYSRLMAGGRTRDPLIRIQWLVVDGSLDQIAECDYVLARTGLDQADWVAPIERQFELLVKNGEAGLEPVARYPIPMKSAEAIVYRVTKPRVRSQIFNNPGHAPSAGSLSAIPTPCGPFSKREAVRYV